MRQLTHDPLTAWREQRRARREFEERAEALCARLPFPTDGPFSIHTFVKEVAEQEHLPIHRPEPEAIEPGALSGWLEVKDDGVTIVYDQDTSRILRWLIIFHELAHLLLGHCKRDRSAVPSMAARFFPNLDAELVRAVLARGTFGDRKELEAEWLARRMLAIALEGPAESGPAVRRWAGHYRTCRRLAPLWRALVQVERDVVLPRAAFDPPWATLLPPTIYRPGDTAYRRVAEILTARRALQPWMDPVVADAARDHGRRAGLTGARLEAVVEAASLAAAARAKARDATPTAPASLTCASLVDAHVELPRLQLVAAAFDSAVVRATLAQQEWSSGGPAAAPRRPAPTG
jgi:Family of unknown function (DUF6545)